MSTPLQVPSVIDAVSQAERAVALSTQVEEAAILLGRLEEMAVQAKATQSVGMLGIYREEVSWLADDLARETYLAEEGRSLEEIQVGLAALLQDSGDELSLLLQGATERFSIKSRQRVPEGPLAWGKEGVLQTERAALSPEEIGLNARRLEDYKMQLEVLIGEHARRLEVLTGGNIDSPSTPIVQRSIFRIPEVHPPDVRVLTLDSNSGASRSWLRDNGFPHIVIEEIRGGNDMFRGGTDGCFAAEMMVSYDSRQRLLQVDINSLREGGGVGEAHRAVLGLAWILEADAIEVTMQVPASQVTTRTLRRYGYQSTEQDPETVFQDVRLIREVE